MTKNWTKVLPEDRLMPYLEQTRESIDYWRAQYNDHTELAATAMKLIEKFQNEAEDLMDEIEHRDSRQGQIQ
jgi:hypothetical protein